jgi:quercetin dioxygenase-like cupin family protein
MSESPNTGFSRRAFLKLAGLAAAVATTAVAFVRRLWAADSIVDFPFKNNVPDPLLSQKELLTFKFALEKSKGKVLGGSFGKEATVEELPISKGLAGVSMRLEPGVTRELHWHATAAEWAFVLEGRVRTTLVDPSGDSEVNDFDPGDVWYFPRGHPHSLACLGDKPCHFILIFDNGYFSEFGTFSITDWIGHTPKTLLAKNFGLPEATFDGFPAEELYFVRGPVPPENTTPLQGALESPPVTHRYRLSPRNRIRSTSSAVSGASVPTVSPFRRQSPAWSLIWSRADCANCTGTRTPTSGNTQSTARSASPCSARTAATESRRWTRATSRTFLRVSATPSRTSAARRPAC